MIELEIANITKKYKGKCALSDFSATLTEGVYGLLGPNGAGKTTLLHIIVNLLDQTCGTVLFNGQNTQQMDVRYLDHIGFLPQYPRFYKNYTAYEFLYYMAVLKGIPKQQIGERISELLLLVNLSESATTKIKAFSGGMRQRLGIAQALINNPDVLILDEPTAGLDPKERIRFRTLISQISEHKIVLIATHIVSDIEYISKEVILLKHGEKIIQDSPLNLMATMNGFVWNLMVSDEKEVQQWMEHHAVVNVKREINGYALRIISEQVILGAQPLAASLEDVYMYYFDESVLV